jgi:2-phospho-L-lactate guanylyltransferase
VQAPGRAVALVPLRTGGKSRLGTRLDADLRARLALAMFDDVAGALIGAGIDDIRVLCGDPGARAAAHERGLTALDDPDAAPVLAPDDGTAVTPELRLRAAVDAGLATVGTSAVRLVVAADLPLLSPDDVLAVLAHADRVTVAPTRGGGTGVLLLPVGLTLASAHGPASAAAHLAAAVAAQPTGAPAPAVIEREGTSWDVDRPEDLDLLLPRLGPRSVTAAVLRSARG